MLSNSHKIKNKLLQFIFVFFGMLLVYALFKVFLLSPSPNTLSYKDSNFSVLGLNIPLNLNFCGEKIPANDLEIKKDLEKEFFSNVYWKNNSKILFRKAQRWFPYIEQILKQEGVPDDFKYLAVIESHLGNVVSPAGAAGFWQLVPASANFYGLEVNEEVDERYDVEKATRAACAHIKQAYKVFNNWTLSAAAYNRGITGILNAMKKQNSDNYYDLILNSETGSFVYRILAYKTLFSNPEHFGIKKKGLRYFPKVPYTIFNVDSSITDLDHFAKSIGTTAMTIKIYNPWLVKGTLSNPQKKAYQIKIPKGSGDYTDYARDLLTAGSSLQEFSISPSEVEKKTTDSLDIVYAKTIDYVVKVNEPLKNLAKFFNVKEEDLRKWNKLNETTEALVGQTLTIHFIKK